MKKADLTSGRRLVSEFISSTLDVEPSGHSSSFNVHSDTLIAESFRKLPAAVPGCLVPES